MSLPGGGLADILRPSRFRDGGHGFVSFFGPECVGQSVTWSCHGASGGWGRSGMREPANPVAQVAAKSSQPLSLKGPYDMRFLIVLMGIAAAAVAATASPEVTTPDAFSPQTSKASAFYQSPETASLAWGDTVYVQFLVDDVSAFAQPLLCSTSEAEPSCTSGVSGPNICSAGSGGRCSANGSGECSSGLSMDWCSARSAGFCSAGGTGATCTAIGAGFCSVAAATGAGQCTLQEGGATCSVASGATGTCSIRGVTYTGGLCGDGM